MSGSGEDAGPHFHESPASDERYVVLSLALVAGFLLREVAAAFVGHSLLFSLTLGTCHRLWRSWRRWQPSAWPAGVSG